MATHRLTFGLIFSFLVASPDSRNANGQRPNDADFRHRLNALESNPDDRPVILMKLLKFKAGGPDREDYQRYLAASVARIHELGGEVIFYGSAKPFEIDFTVSKKVFGFRPCPWDRILLERYGSRKDLLKLAESEDYRKATVQFQGSIEKTEVYALNGSPWSGGTKLSRADTAAGPPEPPSPNDAVYMLNLLKFKPGGKEGYLNNYARAVMPLIRHTHDGKIIYGLEPEQILIGEEEYDRVILVEYPSDQEFKEMLLSDEYQKISHYRTEAIEIGHLYGFSNEAAELNALGQKQ